MVAAHKVGMVAIIHKRKPSKEEIAVTVVTVVMVIEVGLDLPTILMVATPRTGIETTTGSGIVMPIVSTGDR